MDHYLLNLISISFMIGIVIQNHFEQSLYWLVVPLLLNAVVLFLRLDKPYLKIFMTITISLAIGATNLLIQSTPPSNNHISTLIDLPQTITLQGILTKSPTYKNNITRLTIESQFILKENSPETPCTGTLYLGLKDQLAIDIVPGDTLIIKAKLKRPTGYLAEDIFYYPTFLAQKNIWVNGYISSSLHIKRVPSNKKESNKYSLIRYYPEKFRYNFAKKIDIEVPETAPIYKAILLGDRSSIPKATLETFKKLGLMHLLAISGLHMAVLVALMFMGFVRVCKLSTWLMLKTNIYKMSALLTIPIIILYSSITGGHTPVIRAVIISSLVLVAVCINRKKSALTLISLAAILILTISPQYIFTASFQLSFIAVTSIILFCTKTFSNTTQKKKNIKSRVLNYLLLAIQVSFVASLATMPILLFHFNRVSLIGPIANLIIEPLICLLALPLGFMAIISETILLNYSGFFLHIGSITIKVALYITDLLANLRYTETWQSSPTIYIIYFFYLTGVLALILKDKPRTMKLLICLFIISGLSMFSFGKVKDDPRDHHKISYLDVGQGSSTLVQFKNGENILIDAGGTDFSEQTVGEMIIGPYLFKKRIKTINSIFITHGDSDHYNGAKFIIKHFGTEKLITPKYEVTNDNFGNFLKWAELDAKLKIIPVEKGDEFNFGEGNIICVENFTNKKKINMGAVYRLTVDKITALFPGDIPAEEERNLMKLDIDSDILLSAHHGSKTSNDDGFIKVVSPKLVIVSSSSSRMKHFPSQSTKNTFSENNIKAILTAEKGSIVISIQDDEMNVRMAESREFNPLRRPIYKTVNY